MSQSFDEQLFESESIAKRIFLNVTKDVQVLLINILQSLLSEFIENFLLFIRLKQVKSYTLCCCSLIFNTYGLVVVSQSVAAIVQIILQNAKVHQELLSHLEPTVLSDHTR